MRTWNKNRQFFFIYSRGQSKQEIHIAFSPTSPFSYQLTFFSFSPLLLHFLLSLHICLSFHPLPPSVRLCSLPPAQRCYGSASMSSTFSRIRRAVRMTRCGSAPRRWSDGSWRASSPESSWSGTFTQTGSTWRTTGRKRTGVKQLRENSSRSDTQLRIASVCAPPLSYCLVLLHLLADLLCPPGEGRPEQGTWDDNEEWWRAAQTCTLGEEEVISPPVMKRTMGTDVSWCVMRTCSD